MEASVLICPHEHIPVNSKNAVNINVSFRFIVLNLII